MYFKRLMALVQPATLVLAAGLLLTPLVSEASQFKTLLKFNDKETNGASPYAGLIFDASGNLYGTTPYGGTGQCWAGYPCGVVFELTPNSNGKWTETVLYSLSGGLWPMAGLILDSKGALYGTTSGGGAGRCTECGTVFALTPGQGSWTESVLYSFQSVPTDGRTPVAGVIFDGAGNLYGTTSRGGPYQYGTVFRLTPNQGGTWTESVIHCFEGYDYYDGSLPLSGIILDKSGNLYGTTSAGGAYGYGTVYELRPQAGGKWKEEVLYSFNNTGKGGYSPAAGLIFDSAGGLYGTASKGGASGNGTVFKLTSKSGGKWTERVIHQFAGTKDGADPLAGLVFDRQGALYGTTNGGGSSGLGTVFKLTLKGGAWKETVLHSFTDRAGGGNPAAGLVLDSRGNLYGTTTGRGDSENGSVFEIVR